MSRWRVIEKRTSGYIRTLTAESFEHAAIIYQIIEKTWAIMSCLAVAFVKLRSWRTLIKPVASGAERAAIHHTHTWHQKCKDTDHWLLRSSHVIWENIAILDGCSHNRERLCF